LGESEKPKLEKKNKVKFEFDESFILDEINKIGEKVLNPTREKEETKLEFKPSPFLEFPETPSPIIPDIKIPIPKIPSFFFPSAYLTGRIKRVHALPSVIKRQFASPEALLEAPLDILSPAGFEKAKEKARTKKSSGRRKRIRL